MAWIGRIDTPEDRQLGTAVSSGAMTSKAKCDSELDLYRVALVLVGEHGEEAEAVASKRILALAGGGQGDGALNFTRILETIGDLRRNAPNPGETTQ